MKVLDPFMTDEVERIVLEALDGGDVAAHEAIPGLAKSIATLAQGTPDPDQAIDEAISLIEDEFED